MNRRGFLNHSSLALSLSPFLSTMIGRAEAQDCSVWKDVPGFNGRLRAKELWVPEAGDSSKASCKIFQMESGVIIPRHLHPQGEFTFVIEGSFHVDGEEDLIYSKGHSLYLPAGSVHEANVSHGVTVLTFTPTPILFRF